MSEQSEKVERTLRVPRDLYAELEKAAADEERSINAQIIAILRSWQRQRARKTEEDMQKPALVAA